MTTTRSATVAANSTSWVATTTARPCAGERIQRRGQPGLGLVVQASGRLVEQHHPGGDRELDGQHQRELLACRQVTRMVVAGDAGDDAVEHRAGRARRGAVAVGLGEFGVDGVQVEQVGGGLRDQADQAARRGRLHLARVVALPVGAGSVTVPPSRVPEPCSAHSSDDLPEPLRPIRAVI